MFQVQTKRGCLLAHVLSVSSPALQPVQLFREASRVGGTWSLQQTNHLPISAGFASVGPADNAPKRLKEDRRGLYQSQTKGAERRAVIKIIFSRGLCRSPVKKTQCSSGCFAEKSRPRGADSARRSNFAFAATFFVLQKYGGSDCWQQQYYQLWLC